MSLLDVDIGGGKQFRQLVVAPALSKPGVMPLNIGIHDAGTTGVWPHADVVAQNCDPNSVVFNDVVAWLGYRFGAPNGLGQIFDLVGSRLRF